MKRKAIEPENNIENPEYYTQWLIEPTIFQVINKIPFAEGCIIKYVMRWRKKNGIEDLRKAKRYIEMLIEIEENKHLYLPNKSNL